MLIQPKIEFDEMFQMKIGYFLNKAQFSQSIQVVSKDSVTVKGYVEWMVCDNGSCLPPTEYEFAVKLPGVKGSAVTTPTQKPAVDNTVKNNISAPTQTSTPSSAITETTPVVANVPDSIASAPAGDVAVAAVDGKEEGKSLWAIILEAIAWGFVALLTPCVFPMVPMTVSFSLRTASRTTDRIQRQKAN